MVDVNELVTGDYFMVYKPTNITGGAPILYCVKAYESDLMVSIVVLPRIRIRSGIFFHAWG